MARDRNLITTKGVRTCVEVFAWSGDLLAVEDARTGMAIVSDSTDVVLEAMTRAAESVQSTATRH